MNDINLARWREYDDILTDSLWTLESRDSSGAHQADYHGNFIPQIPNQLLRRFTKPGDITLDPFIGSGTTAIEAARLGRSHIGVELSPVAAEIARRRIHEDRSLRTASTTQETPPPPDANIIVGDSSSPSIAAQLKERLRATDKSGVQFLLMHPPYHNIIKFSNDPADLSACPTIGCFLNRFLDVYNNLIPLLENGRHLAVVIGDFYANSEWTPLQNYVTRSLLSTKRLKLKSIIVKNIVNNRAKRNQERLWRYRALAHGFYIFKHEYIVLFQKTKAGGE